MTNKSGEFSSTEDAAGQPLDRTSDEVSGDRVWPGCLGCRSFDQETGNCKAVSEGLKIDRETDSARFDMGVMRLPWTMKRALYKTYRHCSSDRLRLRNPGGGADTVLGGFAGAALGGIGGVATGSLIGLANLVASGNYNAPVAISTTAFAAAGAAALASYFHSFDRTEITGNISFVGDFAGVLRRICSTDKELRRSISDRKSKRLSVALEKMRSEQETSALEMECKEAEARDSAQGLFPPKD